MKIPPLKKSYGERTVLNLPELTLDSGKIYAVVGANGSGKSTMAKLIAGIEAVDSGNVRLDFAPGYMPQKSYAFSMTTRRNILLGGNDPDRCRDFMDALQISHLADKAGNRLSGGETARMALARVLMTPRKLVILDEPTSAMDMESTLLSEQLMQKYCRESGSTILLITHSLQQARRIADEIIYLEHGELVEQGPCEPELTCPKDSRFQKFLEFYGI